VHSLSFDRLQIASNPVGTKVERIVQMAQSPVEFSGESIVDTVKPSPILVLLVDDDACFLKTSKQCLETQGHFQIDTASSVDEAMGKMKKAKYDAVVSDYQMPGKDGLQFLKELRQKGNNIPFIIFTGKGREEVVIKALNLGADHYENKNGDPETVYSELSHDIINAVRTRRAEQELRIQREELQVILDSMPAKIWYKDRNNRLVRVNKAFAEYVGVSKENLEGKPLCDLFPPDIAQKCWEEDKEVITTGQPKTDILDCHESAQGVRWFSTGKVPCREKDGNIIGTISFSVDITERKKAEEALLTERDRLEIVTESIGAGLAVISKDYRTLWANRVLKRIFGDVEGKICYSTYNQRSEICPRCGVREVFETGKDKAVHEQVGKDVDGKIIWSEITATPVKDKNGKVTAAVELVVPVTERKNAEEKLRESGQRFRCLVEDTLVGIATVDTKGRLTYLNRATADMLGYSMSEMLGQSFNSFLHPNDKDKITRAFLKEILLRRKPRLLEFRGVRKDGQVLNLMSKPTKFVLDGKTVGFQAIIMDVSERRKAEKEQLVRKEKAEEYMNVIGNIIVALDSNGRIIVLNKKGHEILGYEERKLLGEDWFETCVPKESRKQVLEVFKACMQGKLEMAQHHENPVLAKNGEKRIVSWYNTVLKDDDGKIIGTLSSGEDITERKKAEESAEESKKKLDAVNEKLRTVGGLTRHDVRNKLSTIVGNVYLSKKKLADNPEILENLEDIESGCNQIVKILDFSKAYEMLGVEELTYVNVEEAVQEAVSLFSDLKAVDVKDECKGLTVLADSLLRQLFYNLIDNSLKHGGKARQIRTHYEIEGDRLRLFYEDDGVGLPPEAKARIFQQGYTTGMGTGYGLYLIKKITEVYGWTMEENGKAGKGARFVMTIPKTSPNVKENYRILTQ